MDNITFASPNSFNFVINKLPDVNFYYQQVTIPEMALPFATQPTTMLDFSRFGDKIEYSVLQVRFMIDKYFNNFKAIKSWIRDLAPPDNNSNFITKDQYSDATLHILDSQNQSIANIKFYDTHPIALSGFTVESTNNTVNYIIGLATFRYTYWDL